MQQEPWSSHRREGDGRLQLRIIVAAGAFEGRGPAVIEDIFSVGMVLEIHRHSAKQPAAFVLDQHMLRQPSGLGGRRAARLQRFQERVRDEGIVGAGAGVPGRRRDLGEALDNADACGIAAVRHGYSQRTSNTLSISTARSNGNTLTPTAVRACFPWSPSTCTIRSEQPFTTCGWLAKSGIELTNPPRRTQRTMRSRSPRSALRRCAKTLKPQSRAAS